MNKHRVCLSKFINQLHWDLSNQCQADLQQISRDPYTNFYTLFYSRIYEIVKWQVTDNVAEHLVTRVTDG